jgi:DNA-binding NtrC family response regulator
MNTAEDACVPASGAASENTAGWDPADRLYRSLVSSAPTDHVTVLSLSPLDEDHRRLQTIFENSRWTLLPVKTCEAAFEAMKHRDAPVVLTEEKLERFCWKEVLRFAQAIRDVPPRVIVTSRLADDALWAEVLNLGGYNVLEKPFDAREVFWVISHAWLDWKAAWDRLAKPKASQAVRPLARAAGV